MATTTLLSTTLTKLGFGALAIGNLDVGGFLTGTEFVGFLGQAIVTILTNLFAFLLGVNPGAIPSSGFF
jgi:hypothetical protein